MSAGHLSEICKNSNMKHFAQQQIDDAVFILFAGAVLPFSSVFVSFSYFCSLSVSGPWFNRSSKFIDTGKHT